MALLIELQAKTPAGAALVARAESLAQRLATTAAEHDTSGTYPLENITVLKEAGYFVAPIPEEFGGQGVESLFDVLIASSQLARGDASSTIGLNMHLLVVMSMVRSWRMGSGGTKHAWSKPWLWSMACHWQSCTSVLRPGRLRACAP